MIRKLYFTKLRLNLSVKINPQSQEQLSYTAGRQWKKGSLECVHADVLKNPLEVFGMHRVLLHSHPSTPNKSLINQNNAYIYTYIMAAQSK